MKTPLLFLVITIAFFLTSCSQDNISTEDIINEQSSIDRRIPISTVNNTKRRLPINSMTNSTKDNSKDKQKKTK